MQILAVFLLFIIGSFCHLFVHAFVLLTGLLRDLAGEFHMALPADPDRHFGKAAAEFPPAISWPLIYWAVCWYKRNIHIHGLHYVRMTTNIPLFRIPLFLVTYFHVGEASMITHDLTNCFYVPNPLWGDLHRSLLDFPEVMASGVALTFPLILIQTNCSTNSRDGGVLRRHDAHVTSL